MSTLDQGQRRGNTFIIFLLLIGFLLMLLSGHLAVQLVPEWRRTDTNMNAAINPDALYTPDSYQIAAIQQDILTLPAWYDLFLTPSAIIPTSPVRATRTLPATPANTATAQPTATPTGTFAPLPPTFTPLPPTNPPPNPTNTSVPPAPTFTFTPPPVPTADLQITKTDGTNFYTAGSTVTYTITVTNNGLSDANGVTVTDNIPTQVTSWTWVCTSELGGASGCTPAAANNANFTDSVNLPNGGSIVYTVTASIASSASGSLANTATVAAPAGVADPVSTNNYSTDTDTLTLQADLGITKTNNATHYAGNTTKTYIITATNSGPSNVTGATVTDTFPANLTNISWTCAATGGASCTASGNGNISDTVNLPANPGASITYTVTANVIAAPSGDLVNTATISVPAGYTDPNLLNNSSSDTDTLIITTQIPGPVGTAPDDNVYNLLAGQYLTLNITTVVNGHAGPDLIYYEYLNAGAVYLDWVIIQISDGQNWYTVFYWGDNIADTHTNVDFNLLPYPVTAPYPPPPEPDERAIPPAFCYPYPGSGVAIDLDQVVPPGIYPWLRLFAPPGDTDGQLEVDAIVPLP